VTARTQAVLKALGDTPRRLTEITRGSPVDALTRRPSAGEWSAAEIVNHLRANAGVWGSTIARMLAEDDPTIRYVSPRGIMKKPEYQCGFAEALARFSADRKNLLATLKPLPGSGWSRSATFTGVSAKRSRATVLDYAENIASHEALHIVQVEALFG
jgi:hypothetical protein